jgi:putative transposase
MVLVSFKTELKLNNQQKTMMAKHAGVARHAYNWGLATCFQALEKNEKLPSSIDLHKKLVAEVKSVYPWYYEVSKCAPQQALRNLSTAFKNWWIHKHTKKPRFKKKGHGDSFYLESSIKISGNRLKLPRIGWVNVQEILPAITPKNVTISRHADRWFIAFKYELEKTETPKIKAKIGVDLGINSLATCSDGTVFENRKAYRKNKRKLARLQRNLSRKEKGSKNRQKARIKLAKQHKKVKQIRLDSIHKLTSWLAKNHGEIVIENLNVSGMLKNHRLASAIADCGFYEFKRQLEDKTQWYGSSLIIADRFYPSSQLCSNCHSRQKMPLSKRVYECSHCGLKIDRDLNASLNLELYPTTDSSSGSKACGELNQLNSKSVKDSVKQEVNIHPMKSGDKIIQ